MASKRGLKRRQKARQCEGKVKHPTLDGAKIAKRKSGHRDVMPYRCKWCGFYHNGHMPRRVLKAMEV
ncbi:hypothetical protein CN213_15905 [Sinorhizobium meliloti]|uniref:hypothetical protein n=1 Tax=Rhizobium meliloti TaxID=382 RepID=UPI000FD7B235|nr:hypothetical protein [Sinorhizobium meliloti]RVH56230.1 hypothetical protein CN213_15905 [Sinorhizobium meliloti]